MHPPVKESEVSSSRDIPVFGVAATWADVTAVDRVRAKVAQPPVDMSGDLGAPGIAVPVATTTTGNFPGILAGSVLGPLAFQVLDEFGVLVTDTGAVFPPADT